MTTTDLDLDDLRAELVALTPSQQAAAEAIVTGATRTDAAGVSRETVSRWANHHPGFLAALSRFRNTLATEQADKVLRIRGKALDVIDRQLDSADLDAALAVLRAIPAPDLGPTDPDAIMDKAVSLTRATQLPGPPMTEADRMAELYGTSERESDDERAERTTVERMADAAGITDEGEAQ
jgi:hypothetical protein